MSGFIGFICAILLVGGFIFMCADEDTRTGGIIALMLGLFGTYACATNPTLMAQRAEENRLQAIADKECQKPYQVSEAGGVELWAYRPTCNARSDDIIYFSKSGTQTTVCHTEGKHTVCNPKRVPNNE